MYDNSLNYCFMKFINWEQMGNFKLIVGFKCLHLPGRPWVRNSTNVDKFVRVQGTDLVFKRDIL